MTSEFGNNVPARPSGGSIEKKNGAAAIPIGNPAAAINHFGMNPFTSSHPAMMFSTSAPSAMNTSPTVINHNDNSAASQYQRHLQQFLAADQQKTLGVKSQVIKPRPVAISPSHPQPPQLNAHQQRSLLSQLSQQQQQQQQQQQLLANNSMIFSQHQMMNDEEKVKFLAQEENMNENIGIMNDEFLHGNESNASFLGDRPSASSAAVNPYQNYRQVEDVFAMDSPSIVNSPHLVADDNLVEMYNLDSANNNNDDMVLQDVSMSLPDERLILLYRQRKMAEAAMANNVNNNNMHITTMLPGSKTYEEELTRGFQNATTRDVSETSQSPAIFAVPHDRLHSGLKTRSSGSLSITGVDFNNNGSSDSMHSLTAAGLATLTSSKTTEESLIDIDKHAQILEKQRRRRESHNAVERRRRDNINDRIQELAIIVPDCEPPSAATANKNTTSNKGTILKKSIEYIRFLVQTNQNLTQRVKALENELNQMKSKTDSGGTTS